MRLSWHIYCFLIVELFARMSRNSVIPVSRVHSRHTFRNKFSRTSWTCEKYFELWIICKQWSVHQTTLFPFIVPQYANMCVSNEVFWIGYTKLTKMIKTCETNSRNDYHWLSRRGDCLKWNDLDKTIKQKIRECLFTS